MPLSAVALALGAAFLHAGGNVLLAGSRDTRASTAGLLVWGVALLALPALLTGGVSSDAIPYIAASAVFDGSGVTLRAGVFALDGSRQLVEEAQGADPAELGRKVAEALLERGAADLIE